MDKYADGMIPKRGDHVNFILTYCLLAARNHFERSLLYLYEKKGLKMDMNSEVIFEVFESRCYHPDITRYDSFGVRAFILTPEGPVEEEIIWDISSDRSRLEAFTARCMRGKIHPRHLRAMVEDEFDLE